jgi:uncharacterized protein (DUF1810 family)
MNSNNLTRFLEAQNQLYIQALSEIKNGQKETHWMWFIFPQISGLGFSETAKFYGIKDLEEADEYLRHPVLGKHLTAIATAIFEIEGKTATQILGAPDDVKLRSCMTLFANVSGADPIFEKVIDKYFHGLQDEYTLQLILKNKFHNDIV